MDLEKVSSSGEKHGRINVVANSVPDNDFKHMKPETKAKAEKKKADEQRLFKARYMNHRGNHERLTRPYMRWAGEPIETWHFIPGEVYDVWKGLVDEVNGNPGLVQRSDLCDANGVPMPKDKGAFKIHEFVPCSF